MESSGLLAGRYENTDRGGLLTFGTRANFRDLKGSLTHAFGEKILLHAVPTGADAVKILLARAHPIIVPAIIVA
jgi:hypothetical protein